MARTMKQLSGLDATFLHLETPEMPMHVGALHVFEIPPGQTGKFVTRLRAHIASRLPAAPVLRRRLWWMPLNLANPAWVDAEPDLKQHIVEIKLPPSAKLGDGQAALEEAVSQLHPVLLDRKRPLWKMHVLEGLANAPDGSRRVGLYTQFHHAAVDGQAAVALAQVILDLQAAGRDLAIRPSSRSKVFQLGWQEMLRGAIANEASQVAQIVKQLPGTAKALAGAAGAALQRTQLLAGDQATPSNLTLAPRTVLNQSVGPGRAFAAISLPLDRLKASARTHEATLNDIVLLLCSTALRRWLGQHGGVPRKSLVAAVPISLRAKGDTSSDNQASMSLVSLGTQVADLRKRLAHIKQATSAMKATVGGLKSVLPTDFPSIGVPWLMEALTALYGKAKVADRIPQVANLVISNVPGPPVPLFMAGARMTANFPTSIVVHGMALNITVQSYDQQMDFGLMADAAAMPDVRTLADALRVAFDDLCLLDDELNAPPTLADTGLAVAAQAGKRVQGGLSSMGGKVGSLVGGMVGSVVKRAVQGAVSGAVKPAAKPAPAARKALAKAAGKRPRTIKA
ncbi:diacylglycerol O-acyltransferase [Rubrivivax pictus]|uniref:diacylglycerol O-acyltransferase n=2 Tax=Pseudaquabacterium pictum TaxID=2315236 RepID=A0A480AK16_9BURK|nr:diacylglycerol O-acyltransferase [Rubrivivax pictus]